jgi:ribosomal protein S14
VRQKASADEATESQPWLSEVQKRPTKEQKRPTTCGRKHQPMRQLKVSRGSLRSKRDLLSSKRDLPPVIVDEVGCERVLFFARPTSREHINNRRRST